MGHRSYARNRDRLGIRQGGGAITLICIALVWSSLALAEPGRGSADRSAGPKRSYGAIDVILYQTSW